MALRVMSFSCLPDLPDALDCVPSRRVCRGVKNLVNRLGVMVGGFLSFLGAGMSNGGGDEATLSGSICSWSNRLPWDENRCSNSDIIVATRLEQSQSVEGEIVMVHVEVRHW